jgi:GNAT superfamily N-acetyltransferase
MICANPLWVAEFGEVIVAWIATEASRIIGLYVDPSYSRRGFASRLLMVAEHELRASGVHTITLESSRNAEDFYLRHGYEPTADRPIKGPRPMRKVLDAPKGAQPLRSAP